MLEPVPLGVDAPIDEPMRSGEIDDHAARRDVESRGVLMGKAHERDVRTNSERCGVRDESRNATPAVPAEPGIERVGRLPRERVGTQRIQLERRVRKHTVERLLTGVPRSSHYRHARHGTYYAY